MVKIYKFNVRWLLITGFGGSNSQDFLPDKNVPLFVFRYRGGWYFQLFGGVLFGQSKKRTNKRI